MSQFCLRLFQLLPKVFNLYWLWVTTYRVVDVLKIVFFFFLQNVFKHYCSWTTIYCVFAVDWIHLFRNHQSKKFLLTKSTNILMKWFSRNNTLFSSEALLKDGKHSRPLRLASDWRVVKMYFICFYHKVIILGWRCKKPRSTLDA